MPRRPHRVFSITTPCTLLATLIMFATESIASVCPDEAPVDRSKQGEWTCTFDLQTRAVHVSLLRGSGGPQGHSHLLWWPEERSQQSARVWKRQGEALSPGTLFPIPTPGNFFCSGHSFLPDGRLLVTGGTEKFNDFGTRAINVFNPRSGTAGAWEPLAPDSLEAERWYPTNTTLPDGKVFITAGRQYDVLLAIGGSNGSANYTQTHALAIQQRAPRLPLTFTTDSPTVLGRVNAAYVDLSMSAEVQECGDESNRLFAIMHAGINGVTPLDDLWGLKWDFRSDRYTWVQMAPSTSGVPLVPGQPDLNAFIPVAGIPPSARHRHAATFDPFSQAVYVFGGRTAAGPSAELFKLANVNAGSDCSSPSLAWQTLNVSGGPSARYGHSAVYDIIHKRVVVFGGSTNALGTQMSNEVWILKNLATTPQWVKLDRDPSSVGTPRGRIGASVAYDSTFFFSNRNNRLLVHGGFEGASQSVFSDTLWRGDILEEYTPPRIRWSPINRFEVTPSCSHTTWVINQADPPPARGDAAALIQHDPYNRFIIYGGDTNGGQSGGVTSEVWEFDLGKFNCNEATGGWIKVSRLHDNNPTFARTGHGLVLDTRYRTARSPEIYDPVTRLVDPPKMASGSFTPNIARWLFSYPFLFLLPNGKLFYAGPDATTRRFNFETGWADSVQSQILGDTGVFSFVSGGVQVMKCGQKANSPSLDTQRRVEIIDPTGAGTWELSPSGTPGSGQPQSMERAHQDGNLTILSNGQVLLTGGVTGDFLPHEPEDDVNELELWTCRYPQLWSPATKRWDSHLTGNPPRLAKEPVFRDYHAAAILLPDGRVFSSGGESEIHGPDAANRRRSAAIYSPHYLFNSDGSWASRPTIAAIDTFLTYGCPFRIEMADAASILKVSMIRPGSVTHGFNQEQRFFNIPFTSAVEGTQRILSATAPGNPADMPPGDYLVFALTSNDVPSIARWVRLLPGGVHQGTLDTVKIWKAGEVHHLAANFTIVSDGSLTIQPGATVTAAGGVKLKVDASNAQLTATGASFINCTGGPWGGIEVASGSASISQCLISYATTGVHFSGTGQGSAVRSRLSSIRNAGIKFTGSGACSAVADTVVLSAGPSTAMGVHVGSDASANPLVKNCVLQGVNGQGHRGMYVERMMTALGNHIHDFNGTNGRGIHFVLTDTTVTPLVNNPASPDTNHTIITNCKIAIFADSFSRPKIRGARIKSCATAIKVSALAQPDVGTVMPPGQSNGNCDVTGGTTFVYVDVRLDPALHVLAYGNWWGTNSSSTISTKMVGAVYWDPFLTQDPFISLARRWGVEDATNGPSRTVRVVPNPTRSGARLIASLEAADASVRYRVFDVAGRLIRTSDAMPSDTVAAEWEWDARDASGRRVKSGIYFVQLSGRSGVLATGRAIVSE